MLDEGLYFVLLNANIEELNNIKVITFEKRKNYKSNGTIKAKTEPTLFKALNEEQHKPIKLF